MRLVVIKLCTPIYYANYDVSILFISRHIDCYSSFHGFVRGSPANWLHPKNVH